MNSRPAFALLGLSLALTAVTVTDDALACSCMPPESPAKELAKSTAVFEAIVDSITSTPVKFDEATGRVSGGDVAHVTVLRAWKGTTPHAHLDIHAGVGGGMCGYHFEKKKYVVYANRNDGRLGTSLCSRTELSEYAKEDFAALGPGKT